MFLFHLFIPYHFDTVNVINKNITYATFITIERNAFFWYLITKQIWQNLILFDFTIYTQYRICYYHKLRQDNLIIYEYIIMHLISIWTGLHPSHWIKFSIKNWIIKSSIVPKTQFLCRLHVKIPEMFEEGFDCARKRCDAI